MMLKEYPECFGSYKVYETVRGVMLNYAREIDIDKMIGTVMADEGSPENFLKKLAVHSKRHMNVNKASKMIMAIKDKLADLIGIHVEPKDITITKNGNDVLKIYVENKTDAMIKFKVGVQQIDRDYTALIYDPVKNFTHTKMIKGFPIEPNKAHVFKFKLKPDVFGIQDLYELKKNNRITITLGMQAAADGIDGMKTALQKIPVNIVRVKL